jgi:uncharacterized membrane protein YqaE (UPF0057 family)
MSVAKRTFAAKTEEAALLPPKNVFLAHGLLSNKNHWTVSVCVYVYVYGSVDACVSVCVYV